MAQDFLSFIDFLDQQKVRYNKQKFINELEYSIITYNRYNVKYLWYCQQHKLDDDRYVYFKEKYEFERKPRNREFILVIIKEYMD